MCHWIIIFHWARYLLGSVSNFIRWPCMLPVLNCYFIIATRGRNRRTMALMDAWSKAFNSWLHDALFPSFSLHVVPQSIAVAAYMDLRFCKPAL